MTYQGNFTLPAELLERVSQHGFDNLLYEPLHQLKTRMIKPWDYKTSSGCRKFDWNIDLKRHAEEVIRKGENGFR